MTTQKEINNMLACHQCDRLFPSLHLQENEKALCLSCDSVLFIHKKDSINRTLAVSLAGLLLFIPTMLLHIVSISAAGKYNQASLFDCIRIMVNDDFYIIASAVFMFTIAFPLVKLISALYISLCIKYDHIKPSLLVFFRSYQTIDCWAMTHVFFMGVIVSMYKLMVLADMSVGGGLWSLVGLLLCTTLVSNTMDEHLIWDTLEASVESK